MNDLIQLLVLADNVIIRQQMFTSLRTAYNMQSLTVGNAQAVEFFRLDHFYLDNCKELSIIVLAGTLGINILPSTPTQKAVPLGWKNLTRLSSVSFGNCSFSAAEMDALIVGFSEVVNGGCGSAILTAKTLLLNGSNAKPTLTDAKVAEAMANLLAKGWTVTKN